MIIFPTWKERLQKIQDIAFNMPDTSPDKAIILEQTIQLWRVWKAIENLDNYERRNQSNSELK